MRGQNGDAPRDEISLRIARAGIELGRIAEVALGFREVIDSMPPGNDRADACSELYVHLSRYGMESEALPLLEGARAECEDPQLVQVIECQLAGCLQAIGKGAEAVGRMKLTPALAVAVSDARLLARATLTTGGLLVNQLKFDEAAHEYRRASEYGLETGDIAIAARALHCASTCHLQLGALDEWRALSTDAQELAERCRGFLTLLEIHSVRAVVHQMRGDEAATQLERQAGLQALEKVKRPTGEALYITTADLYLRGLRGDMATWQAMENEVRSLVFPDVANEPARWIALVKLGVFQGHTKDACLDLRQLLHHVRAAPEDLDRSYRWVVGAFNAADCVADIGDKNEAVVRYEHLKPFAHLLVPHALPPLVLGRLAALIGKQDEALKWLMDARERAIHLRLVPFEGQVDYELGVWYERKGDRAQAEQYLRNAMRIFQELNMPYYHDRAAKRLGAVTRAQEPMDLTPRQREIFVEWGRGKTPKEIADEMVLSPLTVRSHLAAARHKTGTRNQNEALRWCISHGFISTNDLEEAEPT